MELGTFVIINQHLSYSFISTNLAAEVAKELHLSQVPAAFVAQCGEFKGTLVTSKYCSDGVHIHESMRMHRSPPNRGAPQSTLEIISYTRPAPVGRLTRQLVLGLEHLDVPRTALLKLLDEEVKRLRYIYSDNRSLSSVLQREQHQETISEEFKTQARTAVALLGKSSRTSKENTDLERVRDLFFKKALHSLRDSASIAVPRSRLLLGILDPSGTLEEGQVRSISEKLVTFKGVCSIDSSKRIRS
jgi:hypothetical protein